jgi:hypothetical protein
MKEAVPVLRALKIGDEKVDLNYLLNSPFEDIREACECIPAAMGYIGDVRSRMVERMLMADKTWKESEAKAYFSLRNGRFQAEGYGDKMTEEALKRAVELDPTVREWAEKYANYKRNVEWLNDTIQALRYKIELVRSSETTRRLAEEPDPNPRERQSR